MSGDIDQVRADLRLATGQVVTGEGIPERRRNAGAAARRLAAGLPGLLDELEQLRAESATHDEMRLAAYAAAERDRARADLAAERQRADQAEKLLASLVDPDPCWFDHNGDCQAHGWTIRRPGGLCGHEQAKRVLGTAVGDSGVPGTAATEPTCEHGKTAEHWGASPSWFVGWCPGRVAATDQQR